MRKKLAKDHYDIRTCELQLSMMSTIALLKH